MTRLYSIAVCFFKRSSLEQFAGLLLIAVCLWSTDSRGQAPTPDVSEPPAVDRKLLLIGSLASSHVYTTFGYIGVVADNAQKDLYTPQRVDDLMQEINVISDSLISQLEALPKTDLTVDDAGALQEIIEIYKLLKKESDSLRVYAKDRTEAHGGEFNRLRAEARTRVFQLIGIPVESEPK